MSIFKRLFGWAMSVFNDIFEGFILHESTGAVFDL